MHFARQKEAGMPKTELPPQDNLEDRPGLGHAIRTLLALKDVRRIHARVPFSEPDCLTLRPQLSPSASSPSSCFGRCGRGSGRWPRARAQPGLRSLVSLAWFPEAFSFKMSNQSKRGCAGLGADFSEILPSPSVTSDGCR